MKSPFKYLLILSCVLFFVGCSNNDNEAETEVSTETAAKSAPATAASPKPDTTKVAQAKSDSSSIGQGDLEITFNDKVYKAVYTETLVMKNGGPTPTTHLSFRISTKNYPLTDFSYTPEEVIDINLLIPYYAGEGHYSSKHSTQPLDKMALSVITYDLDSPVYVETVACKDINKQLGTAVVNDMGDTLNIVLDFAMQCYEGVVAIELQNSTPLSNFTLSGTITIPDPK